MQRRSIDRRSLLAGGLALGGLTLLSSRAHGAVRLLGSPRLGAAPRTLLLLQLSGGNDGLNTVVPYADDAYHRARPKVGIPAGEVLRLDDHVGLHPELHQLHARCSEGKLAVVQGCGYPEPVRSHFRSMEVWHAGDPAVRARKSGWIGRLAETHLAAAEPNPNLVVHLGTSAPYSLHSVTQPPVAVGTPSGYRWAGAAEEVEAYGMTGDMDGERKEPETNLDFLRQVLADGQASSAAIRRAAASYRTPVEYPRDPFAAALRDLAALVHGELGTRVFSIELGGFDTHTEQPNRHRQLLQKLDQGLGAFLADVERSEIGREVLVLAFSEFGRRVAENGSRGTDHGAAGPMFLAGAAVKGGLHGEHPSLTDLDDGDLRFGIDFRRVYATVLQGWFGADAAAVLGGRFAPLPLLA